MELESIIIMGVVGGASIATGFDYYLAQKDIKNKVRSNSVGIVITGVRESLKEMDKMGWMYNNVLQVGTRIVYENFLRKNGPEEFT